MIHASGQELFMSGPLSEICKENGLPETFIQIHQSFVVNYEHVQRIGYQQIQMDNGIEIPISLPYRKKVQERVMVLSTGRRWHR